MALIRATSDLTGGGSDKVIAILDGENTSNASPVTAQSPISCTSFDIISTDIRSSIIAGNLSINGTPITAGEITQIWQSSGSFGGRATIQHAISKGDTISFLATAGTYGSHVGLVMFVE